MQNVDFHEKEKERITITGGQLGSNNFSHEHTTLTNEDFFVSWRMVFGVIHVGFPFNNLYWFLHSMQNVDFGEKERITVTGGQFGSNNFSSEHTTLTNQNFFVSWRMVFGVIHVGFPFNNLYWFLLIFHSMQNVDFHEKERITITGGQLGSNNFSHEHTTLTNQDFFVSWRMVFGVIHVGFPFNNLYWFLHSMQNVDFHEKEKERITITGGQLGSNNFSHEHTTLTNQDFFVSWRMVFGDIYICFPLNDLYWFLHSMQNVDFGEKERITVTGGQLGSNNFSSEHTTLTNQNFFVSWRMVFGVIHVGFPFNNLYWFLHSMQNVDFHEKEKERITITGGQLGSNNFSHEHTTLTNQDFFVSWRMVFGVIHVGFPFNNLYWFLHSMQNVDFGEKERITVTGGQFGSNNFSSEHTTLTNQNFFVSWRMVFGDIYICFPFNDLYWFFHTMQNVDFREKERITVTGGQFGSNNFSRGHTTLTNQDFFVSWRMVVGVIHVGFPFNDLYWFLHSMQNVDFHEKEKERITITGGQFGSNNFSSEHTTLTNQDFFVSWRMVFGVIHVGLPFNDLYWFLHSMQNVDFREKERITITGGQFGSNNFSSEHTTLTNQDFFVSWRMVFGVIHVGFPFNDLYWFFHTMQNVDFREKERITVTGGQFGSNNFSSEHTTLTNQNFFVCLRMVFGVIHVGFPFNDLYWFFHTMQNVDFREKERITITGGQFGSNNFSRGHTTLTNQDFFVSWRMVVGVIHVGFPFNDLYWFLHSMQNVDFGEKERITVTGVQLGSNNFSREHTTLTNQDFFVSWRMVVGVIHVGFPFNDLYWLLHSMQNVDFGEKERITVTGVQLGSNNFSREHTTLTNQDYFVSWRMVFGVIHVGFPFNNLYWFLHSMQNVDIREKEKERITITGGRLGSNNFSSEHTTLTNQDFFVSWRIVVGVIYVGFPFNDLYWFLHSMQNVDFREKERITVTGGQLGSNNFSSEHTTLTNQDFFVSGRIVVGVIHVGFPFNDLYWFLHSMQNVDFHEKEKERITITGGRLGSNNFSSEHTTLTNQDFFVSWRTVVGVIHVGFPFNDLYWFLHSMQNVDFREKERITVTGGELGSNNFSHEHTTLTNQDYFVSWRMVFGVVYVGFPFNDLYWFLHSMQNVDFREKERITVTGGELGSNNFSHEHTTLTNEDFFVSWRMVFGVIHVGFPFNDLYWFLHSMQNVDFCEKETITLTGGRLGSNNFSHEHTTLTNQDFFVSWRMVFGVVYVGFPFNDLYWFLHSMQNVDFREKETITLTGGRCPITSLLLGVDWAPITFLMSAPRLPIKIFSLAEGWWSVLFMLVFRLTTCTDCYTRCKMSILAKKKESLLLGVN